MSRIVVTVLAIGLATCRAARAGEEDPEAVADRAFRAATRLSATEPAAAIAAFEAVAALRPLTRWTDNAWAEAARLAERAADYPRARRALEQVVAIGSDPAMVRRARDALARLGDDRWDAIARDHERLASEIYGGGDPRDALEALERLVRGNPAYPRAAGAWLVLGEGWEREGHPDRAIELLRVGLASDRVRLGMTLARTLIRRGELAAAAAQLDELAALPGADRGAIGNARSTLDVASRRASIRGALWLALAVLAFVTCGVLRCDAGSWRRAARGLVRPPVEAVFLLPIGALLVAVGEGGNPLVGKAVWAIVLSGIAVAWLSGVLFEARAKHCRITARRAILQAVLALAAVAGSTYLAVDRDRLLDLIDETVEHGPVPR